LSYELHLVSGERVLHTLAIGVRPTQIGRLPSNDLVVNDPMVSQHHALVWSDTHGVHIRDLGSRNGTRVNGKRIQAPTKLEAGDRIEIGPDTALVLRLVEGYPDLPTPQSWMLEDVDSGVCVPIGSDRYSVMSPGGDEVATLLVFDNGEVWLGKDEQDSPIEVDVPFEVAGRRLRLRRGTALSAATVAPAPDRYPYTLDATLNGATGPEAVLRDGTEHEHRVLADNRAILMYLLARQWHDDKRSGVKLGERGWIADHDVLTGIWGRDAKDENKLHVLVYRLRNEVKNAGFDPWFIEKRRRYIRARLAEARIDEERIP